jgi:biopolymer transport protein ExbD
VSQLQNEQAKGPIQLQIHADEAVPYGRMAAVMALVQSAGVTNLSFVILQVVKSQ